MKKRKKQKIDIDNDMPIGELVEVNNFLPPPSELVLPEESVKVTISLNRSSIEFFKKEAEKNGTKYQRMIREVLDRYTSHYKAA
jgi:predicted DNA binding CopG/RHH family protein